MGWFADFLTEVKTARAAVDRRARLLEAAEARAYSIADPLGHAGIGGGGPDRAKLNPIEQKVYVEQQDDLYEERETLRQFERFCKAWQSTHKPSFGFDVCAARYGDGLTYKEIAASLHCSRQWLYMSLRRFVEMVEQSSPAAFGLTL